MQYRHTCRRHVDLLGPGGTTAVETILAAAVLGAGVDPAAVDGSRFVRARSIPRRAAADALQRILGWKRAAAARACKVSKALLVAPSKAHAFDPRANAARSAADAAALQVLHAIRQAEPAAASTRRRALRDRTVAALRAQASVAGIDYDEACSANTASAVTARRLVILDLVAEGVARRDIAEVMGVGPEYVSRVASGKWAAVRPSVDRRDPKVRAMAQVAC